MARRSSLSIFTPRLDCFPWLGANKFDLLCIRFLVIDTRDCFIDLEDAVSAFDFPFAIASTLLFSLPRITIADLPESLLICLMEDFAEPVFKSDAVVALPRWPTGFEVDSTIAWPTGSEVDSTIALFSAVVFNDMSIRDKDVLLSPLSSNGASVSEDDLDLFFAGFIGLQRGAALQFSC